MSDVNTARNRVTFKTSDGKELEVSLTVAKQSKTIRDLIEDAASPEDPIPLNITEPILKMVIQFCEKHLEAAEGNSTSQLSPRIPDRKLRNWDRQFVDSVGIETVLDLMQAATYLNIQALLYATCRRIAEKMKNPRKKERFDVLMIS